MSISKIQKYNMEWDAGTTELQMNLWFIKKWRGDLKHHHKSAIQILWPEDDWHRWLDLCIEKICENKSTALLGPASSNKTDVMAKFALLNYWAAPQETCVLVSSTEFRGLELRVWGRIKGLFNRGMDRFDWLAGNVLESKHAVATDDIDDGDNLARIMNKGIICIPCLQGGTFVGLSKYQGIKQKRMILCADEVAAMQSSFLDATANLGSNPWFWAIFAGNPNDPLDPLGQVAEPEDGWDGHPEPTKTTCWKTRMGGVAVNLVGTDSPNNDFPGDRPRYPYLIHKKRIEEIAAFWSKDSQQYYSQAVGVMKTGLLSKRVITRDLCRQHKALDKAIWSGRGERTKIYAIDAAYSGTGGDRCVGGWGEFGEAVDGTTIIRIQPPSVIPVSIRSGVLPEDQIAEYAKRECLQQGIDPTNIFYDSTGRGTLGSAFARVFGTATPVPVEFGGRPSERPVRHDLFVKQGHDRRLKTCREHYYDMVTELWFSVRYIIECDQMRELPDTVMKELCGREYGMAGGNKIFVESKHDPKARERMPISPDLADWLATLVEGARQRGFRIERLGADVVVETDPMEWFRELQNRQREARQKRELSYR